MQDKNVYGALDAKFNSAPTPVAAAVQETLTAKATPVSRPEVLIDDDFDQARQALKDMIKKGQTAVDDIMGIARQSDHPRAFEVTGQLIKTQTEIAKELVGLYKTKKDINKIDKKVSNQTNNIVFAGSTSDLMKMINGDKAKVIDVNK